MDRVRLLLLLYEYDLERDLTDLDLDLERGVYDLLLVLDRLLRTE